MEATTQPTPPPAPKPPVLTRDAFAALTGIAGILAELAEELSAGAGIPVSHARVEQVVLGGRQALVLVAKSLEQLPDEQLFAWASRVADLAALAAMVTHDAMALLQMRRAATAIVGLDGRPASAAPAIVGLDGRPLASWDSTPGTPEPRPRRAEEIAQLPPHLRQAIAVVRNEAEQLGLVPPLIPVPRDEPGPAATTAAGEPVHLVTFDPLYDRTVRVTCKTCNVALGEVGDDVAETVARTHLREKHGAAGEEVSWLHPDVPDPTGGPYDVPTCRRCGCTDGNACHLVKDGQTVGTCSWRELNPENNAGVCTACAE